MQKIENDRLRLLIKNLIYIERIESDAEFARITGISQGLLSQITRDDRPLSLKSIEKIKKAFPNVNENYLKGKESNMYLKEVNKINMVNEPPPEYNKDVIRELIETKNQVITLQEEKINLINEINRLKNDRGGGMNGTNPN